jgi:dethiobiotin synthetase
VPGVFVTGTDTGAGKSVLGAAIVAGLREAGVAVRASKPVVTGVDEEPEGEWPHDHVLLSSLTGQTPEEVSPFRFGPAVSPHLAAELDVASLAAAARGVGGDALVVEGVGGLLVPLGDGASVRDLAVELALPLVVAARPGLGTISHTLLTLESARAAGLDVRAVVLTPWPERPGEIERSNARTIAELGEVRVERLPRVDGPDRATLARAAAALPVAGWLGP